MNTKKFWKQLMPFVVLTGVVLFVGFAWAITDTMQEGHARKVNKEICESYSARAYELGKIPDMCWREWK